MRSFHCAAIVAAISFAPAWAQDPAAPPAQPRTQAEIKGGFRPFDQAKFEAGARRLGATDEQVAKFAGQIAEVGIARAGDDLVRAAVPALGAAVKVGEDNDPRAALELTKVLASSNDPLLQAHARYHLARFFLDSDDPERAVEVLNDYLRNDNNVNVSPLDAEVVFFYAQSLAEIPMPDEALPRFQAFLKWFPDASERLRSAAHQQVLELQRQQESRLHQLADGMKKTTRDLKKQKTDKPVQLDQEKYIEELDELIEMYEEMEKSSSGPPSGNKQSQAPAANSQLVEGDGSVGQLNHRPSVADRWGNMRDSDRKKIEADVQRGLPPQYRRMLEQYYKKLGTVQGRQ